MIRWEDVEAWIRNTGAAVFDFLVKMAVCILVFLVIRRVTRKALPLAAEKKWISSMWRPP